jgi:hypothetical protein
MMRRTNDVCPQDNILQTPSARLPRAARSACECRARHCLSKTWCGRRDLNPHGPFKPCGFSCRLRLSPPGRYAFRKLTPGLRSGLSLHLPPEAPELRCCPSSLYTFPAGISPGLARDFHCKGSPNLSSSASPVSQTSTQVFLKSAAYAIPPRPRAAVLLMIGHVARFYTSVSRSACSTRTGVFHATSVKLASFDFLFLGRITLIATASSEVLMCDA